MERLVVVVTAGATLDGRVHVVAEERPGAPDVDTVREECTQYDLRNLSLEDLDGFSTSREYGGNEGISEMHDA